MRNTTHGARRRATAKNTSDRSADVTALWKAAFRSTFYDTSQAATVDPGVHDALDGAQATAVTSVTPADMFRVIDATYTSQHKLVTKYYELVKDKMENMRPKYTDRERREAIEQVQQSFSTDPELTAYSESVRSALDSMIGLLASSMKLLTGAGPPQSVLRTDYRVLAQHASGLSLADRLDQIATHRALFREAVRLVRHAVEAMLEATWDVLLDMAKDKRGQLSDGVTGRAASHFPPTFVQDVSALSGELVKLGMRPRQATTPGNLGIAVLLLGDAIRGIVGRGSVVFCMYPDSVDVPFLVNAPLEEVEASQLRDYVTDAMEGFVNALQREDMCHESIRHLEPFFRLGFPLTRAQVRRRLEAYVELGNEQPHGILRQITAVITARDSEVVTMQMWSDILRQANTAEDGRFLAFLSRPFRELGVSDIGRCIENCTVAAGELGMDDKGSEICRRVCGLEGIATCSSTAPPGDACTWREFAKESIKSHTELTTALLNTRQAACRAQVCKAMVHTADHAQCDRVRIPHNRTVADAREFRSLFLTCSSMVRHKCDLVIDDSALVHDKDASNCARALGAYAKSKKAKEEYNCEIDDRTNSVHSPLDVEGRGTLCTLLGRMRSTTAKGDLEKLKNSLGCATNSTLASIVGLTRDTVKTRRMATKNDIEKLLESKLQDMLHSTTHDVVDSVETIYALAEIHATTTAHGHHIWSPYADKLGNLVGSEPLQYYLATYVILVDLFLPLVARMGSDRMQIAVSLVEACVEYNQQFLVLKDEVLRNAFTNISPDYGTPWEVLQLRTLPQNVAFPDCIFAWLLLEPDNQNARRFRSELKQHTSNTKNECPVDNNAEVKAALGLLYVYKEQTPAMAHTYWYYLMYPLFVTGAAQTFDIDKTTFESMVNLFTGAEYDLHLYRLEALVLITYLSSLTNNEGYSKRLKQLVSEFDFEAPPAGEPRQVTGTCTDSLQELLDKTWGAIRNCTPQEGVCTRYGNNTPYRGWFQMGLLVISLATYISQELGKKHKETADEDVKCEGGEPPPPIVNEVLAAGMGRRKANTPLHAFSTYADALVYYEYRTWKTSKKQSIHHVLRFRPLSYMMGKKMYDYLRLYDSFLGRYGKLQTTKEHLLKLRGWSKIGEVDKFDPDPTIEEVDD